MQSVLSFNYSYHRYRLLPLIHLVILPVSLWNRTLMQHAPKPPSTISNSNNNNNNNNKKQNDIKADLPPGLTPEQLERIANRKSAGGTPPVVPSPSKNGDEIKQTIPVVDLSKVPKYLTTSPPTMKNIPFIIQGKSQLDVLLEEETEQNNNNNNNTNNNNKNDYYYLIHYLRRFIYI